MSPSDPSSPSSPPDRPRGRPSAPGGRGADRGRSRGPDRRSSDNRGGDRGGDSNRSGAIAEARADLFAGMGVPEQVAFVADDFQREAVSAVANSEDTLVVAPTGAGKTYIALEAIALILAQGLRAVYTTPLKALSNTKFNELKARFEPKYKVGLLTGDRKIDADADVLVATTEIYRNELYRTGERFSLVVLDEVHFIADPQRGPVWEETIILTPQSTTLLMLSASISNSGEIAGWLLDVRGKACRVVQKTERPVQLRFAFLHPDLGVIPLRDRDGGIFPEVSRFYGGTSIDETGTRLRGGYFGGRGRGGDRGGDRRGRGGGRGHRGGSARRGGR